LKKNLITLIDIVAFAVNNKTTFTPGEALPIGIGFKPAIFHYLVPMLCIRMAAASSQVLIQRLDEYVYTRITGTRKPLYILNIDNNYWQ
jgi:hypothetical protein